MPQQALSESHLALLPVHVWSSPKHAGGTTAGPVGAAAVAAAAAAHKAGTGAAAAMPATMGVGSGVEEDALPVCSICLDPFEEGAQVSGRLAGLGWAGLG